MKNKTQYIYLAESLTQSVIADIFTFGTLLFSFWFNYQFIGGNKFLYAILLIIWLLGVIGRQRTKVFDSKKKIIEYLQKDTD